jgi:hypothetical protein
MELDETFTTSAPARQGDLIARANIERRHPFDRFGILITADCDLERTRPETQLTFLRIVPVSEYVKHVWCRKKMHDFLKRMGLDTTMLFNRLSRDDEPTRLPIKPERLIDWLSSSSPQEICDTLDPGRIKQPDIAKLHKRLDELSSCTKAAGIDRLAPALDSLVFLRAQDKKAELEKTRAEILAQAKNELAKESDEVFFLSQLVSEEESEGYYVLLDQVGTIRRDHLFDYKSEADLTEDGAHRFGRLEKTFKYAVVQRFAFLFQRIGLPDERTDLHKGSLQKIG